MKNVLNLKKITSMVVAFVILVLSVCLYSSKTSAANTAQTYSVFNATTGAFLRSYTLNALPAWNNSRGVIGTDDREVDWTKSGVVKINLFNTYFASGFVVDEHTIATAGHVAYDFSSHEANTIPEILLFNNNGNISLHATPVESHVPNAYISNESIDYALITVEEDLSDYACFNLGVAMDNIVNNNQSVSVTGFPKEVNGSVVNSLTNHCMYTGNGIITNIDQYNNNCFDYSVDTSNCNSGSPVYITESRCGYTYYTVIAIHTGGATDNNNNGLYNCGTRVTTNLLHFYNNNPNLNW